MKQKPTTIGELITSGTHFLRERGSATARLDAELLLGFLMEKSRAELMLDSQSPSSQKSSTSYQKLLDRRGSAVPVAYLTGIKEFMSLSFQVDPTVLIPRPETEIMVEQLIKRFHKDKNKISGVDIGTGCGCIAISLAHYLPKAQLYATDISLPALRIAQKNAKTLAVAERVKFFQSALFREFGFHKISAGSLDFIVSNPPYISHAEMEKLPAEVSAEPSSALDGGHDGLDFFRQIITGAPSYLKDNGVLALEIGAGQAKEITAIFNECGRYQFPVFYPDLSGITRVVIAEKKVG